MVSRRATQELGSRIGVLELHGWVTTASEALSHRETKISARMADTKTLLLSSVFPYLFLYLLQYLHQPLALVFQIKKPLLV